MDHPMPPPEHRHPTEADLAATRFKHPTESDAETIARVWNDSRGDLPTQKTITAREVRAETFEDEDYDPEGAWIAFDGDEPIGYADAFVDKVRLEYGKNDGYVGIEVVHAARGSGLERDLLDKALASLRSRGIQDAQCWAHAHEEWKNNLMLGAGFREVRRFYLMNRRRTGPVDKPTFPDGTDLEKIALNGAQDRDLQTLVDARNEAFVDHFNFSPSTVARWKSSIESSEEVLSVTFARDRAKVVGFVVSEDRVAYSREKGFREGWVATLGVVKSHRRRGLGRALLLESIGWLSDRGVEMVRLGVDAENSKALGLYTSVGFEVESESVVLVKNLKD